MSDSRPIIAVTGPTGTQGGSVVKFLLKDGTFRVRAVTLNAKSSRAEALGALGVQVVQADVMDVESVKKAFTGCYGVFGLTNFWAPGMSGELEVKQGKIFVDAAKAVGIQHFVWSTLGHTKDPELAHWNSKATVNDYLIASGVPRTSLYTSFYNENFRADSFFPFEKTGPGKYRAKWAIHAADGLLGAYPADETGGWVVPAFKHPELYIGKDINVLTEIYTVRDIVKIVEEVSGLQIDFEPTSYEEFAKAKDVPELHELWANMEWFYKHKGNPRGDMEQTKAIFPDFTPVRKYIENNLDKILVK